MASGRSSGANSLQSPFLFVKHGDTEPADWKQAHPGWVKFPATLVPRDEKADGSAAGPVRASYQDDGRTGTAPNGMDDQRAVEATQGGQQQRPSTMPPNLSASLSSPDPVQAYMKATQALGQAGTPKGPGAPTSLITRVSAATTQ